MQRNRLPPAPPVWRRRSWPWTGRSCRSRRSSRRSNRHSSRCSSHRSRDHNRDHSRDHSSRWLRRGRRGQCRTGNWHCWSTSCRSWKMAPKCSAVRLCGCGCYSCCRRNIRTRSVPCYNDCNRSSNRLSRYCIHRLNGYCNDCRYCIHRSNGYCSCSRNGYISSCSSSRNGNCCSWNRKRGRRYYCSSSSSNNYSLHMPQENSPFFGKHLLPGVRCIV